MAEAAVSGRAYFLAGTRVYAYVLAWMCSILLFTLLLRYSYNLQNASFFECMMDCSCIRQYNANLGPLDIDKVANYTA